MEKSYVQVYTGSGKGKTTAAVGLAVRAAGAGLCVKFVQFMKGRETGEIPALRKLGVECVRASQSTKFFHQMRGDEKRQMREDVRTVLDNINGWLCSADVLILDEAMSAMASGVLEQDEVLDIIERRGATEIVLTGRDVPDEILQQAHLVTQMKDVRHYYDAGVCARRGIEF